MKHQAVASSERSRFINSEQMQCIMLVVSCKQWRHFICCFSWFLDFVKFVKVLSYQRFAFYGIRLEPFLINDMAIVIFICSGSVCVLVVFRFFIVGLIRLKWFLGVVMYICLLNVIDSQYQLIFKRSPFFKKKDHLVGSILSRVSM